jgi:uncharacterized membrane protein HdeD (DUF308 family)
MTRSSGPPRLPAIESVCGVLPWWALVALGVVSILFSAPLLIWPTASVWLIAILISVALILVGFTWLAMALLGGGRPARRGLSGLAGAFGLAVGVLCLRDVDAALQLVFLAVPALWPAALVLTLGLFGVAVGVAEVALGLRRWVRRRHNRPA